MVQLRSSNNIILVHDNGNYSAICDDQIDFTTNTALQQDIPCPTRDERNDIPAYRDIVNYMNSNLASSNDEYWQFQEIIVHQQVQRRDPQYQDDSFNLRILWEDGELKDELIKVFGKDAPVDCAIYVRKHRLLNFPGWRQFQQIGNR